MADEPITENDGQISDMRVRSDHGHALAHLGCAVPLAVLGAILGLLAAYLEYVVILAATRRTTFNECEAGGPSMTLGGIAVLGICALIAARLALRSTIAASTWWRVLAIALVFGVGLFLLGLFSSDRCPLLE